MSLANSVLLKYSNSRKLAQSHLRLTDHCYFKSVTNVLPCTSVVLDCLSAVPLVIAVLKATVLEIDKNLYPVI